MKRHLSWIFFGIPFLLSLILCLLTIDDRVSWQDSGFYLSGIYELSVLYPPGFVLYQVLCKVWTLLFFFLGFTLAVHLFSSTCIALTGGFMAITIRELLLAKDPLFRIADEESPVRAGWCGVATACLAVSGYTLWYSGTMAKGYALYYLVLTLLLWRMIRATETRRPRDFSIVAVLIGFAWQAHPSSALIGLALVLFLVAHYRLLGWKGIGLKSGLAVAAALGPSLLLPILAGREVTYSFGGPQSVSEWFRYILGMKYTDTSGHWGLELSRVASVGQYLWEEVLGVGLVIMVTGVIRLALVNRRLFLGLLAWVVPLIVVTVCFKIEGQHDLWFVGAWIPLLVVGGVGTWVIVRRVGERWPLALGALSLVGVTSAVFLNLPLLEKREYDLPEQMGKLYFKALEPNALVLVSGDDSLAIMRYLQVVRGHREDVMILNDIDLEGGREGGAGPGYLMAMRRDSQLKALDYVPLARRFPSHTVEAVRAATFVGANFGHGRPIYIMGSIPDRALLPENCVVIPSGPLTKFASRGNADLFGPAWEYDIKVEDVLARMRRKRGQRVVRYRDGELHVVPQAYEERLLRTLLNSRHKLADHLLADPVLGRRPEASLAIYRRIHGYLPAMEENGWFLRQWARAAFRMGHLDEAEEILRKYRDLETATNPALDSDMRDFSKRVAAARAAANGKQGP